MVYFVVGVVALQGMCNTCSCWGMISNFVLLRNVTKPKSHFEWLKYKFYYFFFLFHSFSSQINVDLIHKNMWHWVCEFWLQALILFEIFFAWLKIRFFCCPKILWYFPSEGFCFGIFVVDIFYSYIRLNITKIHRWNQQHEPATAVQCLFTFRLLVISHLLPLVLSKTW